MDSVVTGFARLYGMRERERACAAWTDQLMELGLFRTCCNCAYWQGEQHAHPETCGHAANLNRRPPARIIVSGCSEHSDLIPF